ncbi:MAG: hypothetical protein C4317_08285 [Acidimicrobiia bacterium]
MIDYHVHYHQHGESGEYELQRLESIAETAKRKGLVEVGLSEHVFRFVEFVDVVGDWWNDTDDPKWLRDHCEKYFAQHATQSVHRYLDFLRADHDWGVTIRAGLEVDFFPGRMAEVKQFLDSLELDFVLGSVHWIGAWGFDNEEVSDEWERRDPDSVYEQYFDHLLALASTGVPQVLAHPDLPKKFGYRSRNYDLAAAYSGLVTVCTREGVGLEVSSAGWRVPAQEQYPERQLLEVAVSRGAQLTTASDAHVPELVGYRVDNLCELLKGLGCREIYGYRQRRPIRFPLDPPENSESRS